MDDDSTQQKKKAIAVRDAKDAHRDARDSRKDSLVVGIPMIHDRGPGRFERCSGCWGCHQRCR